MNTIKVGDRLWHPCSRGIIEHKVIGIHQYEDFTQVVTKSSHTVGTRDRLECIIDVRKDRLTFVELRDEDELEYVSGLQDFIEGEYYKTRAEAKLVFYKTQKTLASINVDDKKRMLREAEARLRQVEAILKQTGIECEKENP